VSPGAEMLFGTGYSKDDSSKVCCAQRQQQQSSHLGLEEERPDCLYVHSFFLLIYPSLYAWRIDAGAYGGDANVEE